METFFAHQDDVAGTHPTAKSDPICTFSTPSCKRAKTSPKIAPKWPILHARFAKRAEWTRTFSAGCPGMRSQEGITPMARTNSLSHLAEECALRLRGSPRPARHCRREQAAPGFSPPPLPLQQTTPAPGFPRTGVSQSRARFSAGKASKVYPTHAALRLR